MGIIHTDGLVITPEILKLIAEIDEFKGAWLQAGRLSPDRLFSLKRVATIESIGSSTRIEGAKLCDKEIEALLMRADTKNFATRDEQEVAGYADACQLICEHFQAIPLTENHIKDLHARLLHYSNKDDGHRGHYKKIPIRIEAFDNHGKSAGILFETVSPFETPLRMQELFAWTNEAFKNQELHPLIIIALFVVIFLAIHPFQDGNGRLSRLLTTLLMLKCGYVYCPYSSLESVIESNKEGYYLALQRSQKSWQNKLPDWNAWLLFFLHCLQRQKHHLALKLEKEHLLAKALSPLSQQIFELVRTHSKLTISDLVALTAANRNTLKKVLTTLVKGTYLTQNGKGKGTWYTV